MHARKKQMETTPETLEAQVRFFEDSWPLIAHEDGQGDLRRALSELVQLAAQSANSRFGSFYVVDPTENVLKPLVTYGLPQAFVQACGNVRIGDQCCGRAVEQRKPWSVSDMLSDPLFASAREAAVKSPIRSGFSVPVIDESGKCLGSLGSHFEDVHVASPDEILRNQTWAHMIAHTISVYNRSRKSA